MTSIHKRKKWSIIIILKRSKINFELHWWTHERKNQNRARNSWIVMISHSFKSSKRSIQRFKKSLAMHAMILKASFLEVNLRRKCRRWAHHFYLVRSSPINLTKPRFAKRLSSFLTMRSKIVRCSGVTATQCLQLRFLIF